MNMPHPDFFVRNMCADNSRAHFQLQITNINKLEENKKEKDECITITMTVDC